MTEPICLRILIYYEKSFSASEELVEEVLPVHDDLSQESDLTVSLMWCKSRLSMHKSISVFQTENSRLDVRDERWRLAMRHLVDAESYLSMFDARRREADQAIIDLYRADVRLHQAAAVELHRDRGEHLSFGLFCASFDHVTNDAEWRVHGEKIVNEYCPKGRSYDNELPIFACNFGGASFRPGRSSVPDPRGARAPGAASQCMVGHMVLRAKARVTRQSSSRPSM